MAEQRSFRKLTRADVVVVGGICLLLILLVPVLFAKPREQAIRKVCAANLAQIGKAMLIYAADNKGEFPRAGGRTTVWSGMPGSTSWMATDRRTAFAIAADGTGGSASINASFYLLVKYNRMPPKVFVCAADKGTTEFKLSSVTGILPNFELIDAWDFGPSNESYRHCSYAYHIPYGLYALTTNNDPNLAVAADRNPWIVSPASAPATWADFLPDVPTLGLPVPRSSEQARRGNSITHQLDGQNVLFLDGRVTFEKRSSCGVDKDNIYTMARPLVGGGDPWGVGIPVVGPNLMPSNRKDSVLVHDPDTLSYGPPKRR